MRKEAKATYITISILLIIAISLFIFLSMSIIEKVQFSPLDSFQPPFPADCSNESIEETWDYFFHESSSGLTIKTNISQENGCNVYLAHKHVDESTYLMMGLEFSFFIKNKLILALHGNFTQEFIDTLSSATIYNHSLINQSSSTIILEKFLKLRNISSIGQADNEFTSVFEYTPTSWHLNISENLSSYEFLTNKSNESRNNILIGSVIANYTMNILIYSQTEIPEISISSCSPNWIAQNTSCKRDDTIITYYLDENLCGDIPPNNITEYCDFDNNGLIGNFSELNEKNINTRFYIGSERENITKTYNRTEKVEIKENNIVRAEFIYDFSLPINLKEIEIEKQPSNFNYGYLIVNGIDKEKKFKIDRINGSKKICIRNSHVREINDFTTDCSAAAEELIICPGTKKGFTCNLTTDLFTVDGLSKSAVKEITNNSCNPLWNCTLWSPCINGNQTKTCTDLNFCGINQSKPIERRGCSITCSPNWNCTSWEPAECPKNETKLRTCTDLNNCNLLSDKPIENGKCEYLESQNYNIIFISILVLVSIAIIAVLFFIIRTLRKKTENEIQFNQRI